MYEGNKIEIHDKIMTTNRMSPVIMSNEAPQSQEWVISNQVFAQSGLTGAVKNPPYY